MATKQKLPVRPTWQGREVNGLHVAFSGKDEDLGLELDQDVPLVLIVRGKVTSSAFKTNTFGTDNLVQSFRVDSAVLADEETAAAAAARIKARDDELSGQASLDAELDGELDG